jgi:copper chaperone
MNLHIPNMSCGGYVKTVTGAIQEADPSASVSCDLTDRTVLIETEVPAAAVLSRLSETGYPATQR